MQIREIMTRAVETIAPDASLREAAKLMENENVGFLPVVREGRLVGVITDRDIAIRAVSRGMDPEQTRVEQAMTDETVSLPENCEIEDASDLMEDKQVRRLVITGEDDAPVGVVSIEKVSLYAARYGRGEEALQESPHTSQFATGGSGEPTPGGDTSVGDEEDQVQPSDPDRTVSDESDLEPSGTARETNRKAREGGIRDPNLFRRG